METQQVMSPAESYRVVQTKRMGPMHRLFGSLGIDGDGTEFEVDNVDPFIMCDFVNVPINLTEPPMRPPFCAHPHAGNAVASILIEGEDMSAWDNVQGFEKSKIRAGGVYVVCTGKGCVHDEGPDPVVIERVIRRAPFAQVGDDRPGKRFRFFQLWFDPGHVHAEEGPPPVSSVVVQPEEVPMISAGAMKIRVLIGTYGGLCRVEMPITILHCSLLPFSSHGTLKVPANSAGFVFSIERTVKVTIGAEVFTIPSQQEMLMPVRPDAYEMRVEVEVEQEGASEEARADDALEFLVGFGVPIGKPFYKLLGYGGALVASSEEKVRSLMLEYERDPKRFGVASGASEADMSRFGTQSGYKNPLDGRGECQRTDPTADAPEARWFFLEKGPYQPKGKGKGS